MSVRQEVCQSEFYLQMLAENLNFKLKVELEIGLGV